MKSLKWRAMLGLLLLYFAIFMNWDWVWGVLFIFWVLPDLFSGITHFIEPVAKRQNPITYWLIVGSWLGLSALMIVGHFFPQVYGDAWRNNNPKMIAYSLGVYEPEEHSTKHLEAADNHSIKKDSKSAPSSNLDGTTETPKPALQQIGYKDYQTKTDEFFIGISTETSFEGDVYFQHLEELWAYFLENDIYEVIENIIDENKVYVVYSGFDPERTGMVNVTIGFKVSNLDNIYEGLTGIQIPPTHFAVFESQGDPEKFIESAWEKVFESDLPKANTFDLEVYELNSKTYHTEKSELRISINPPK